MLMFPLYYRSIIRIKKQQHFIISINVTITVTEYKMKEQRRSTVTSKRTAVSALVSQHAAL